MSKIKQIDTGKCEILAVMVPDGVTEFRLIHNETKISWLIDDRLFHATLPQGNWQILGLSTEITEEQWYDLVNSLPDPYSNSHHRNYKDYRRNYSITRSQYIFNTAKESGLSLLEANECYNVNPIPQPEAHFDEMGNGGYCDTWVSNWQEAEANTGRWLILKQL